MQGVEVDLPEPVQLGPMPERGLERVAELGEELLLGQLALLELVERMLAVDALDLRHRLAELLERDPGLVLNRGERLDERSGEHAAEVRDHRGDLIGRAHERQSR